MKKTLSLLAALALLAAAPASAATWTASAASSTIYTSTQNLTGSAPTTIAEGVSLGFVTVCTLSADIGSGKTITGGTLQAYVWNDALVAWVRAPDVDIAVPNVGTRYWTASPFKVLQTKGRVEFVPSAVTGTGAPTTVALYLDCTR